MLANAGHVFFYADAAFIPTGVSIHFNLSNSFDVACKIHFSTFHESETQTRICPRTKTAITNQFHPHEKDIMSGGTNNQAITSVISVLHNLIKFFPCSYRAVHLSK